MLIRRRQFDNTIGMVLVALSKMTLINRSGYWRKTYGEVICEKMVRNFEQCLTHLRRLRTQNAQRNEASTEDSLLDMFIERARHMRRELRVSDDCLIVRGVSELPVQFRRGENKATSKNNLFGGTLAKDQAGKLAVSNSADRNNLYAIYKVVCPFLRELYDGLPEEKMRQCMIAILMVDRDKLESGLSVANSLEN